MTKLEIAKKIIKENINFGRLGLFNCRSMFPDPMDNLYNEDGLTIDICYSYEYFEVFGLTSKEFVKLKWYYDQLCSI